MNDLDKIYKTAQECVQIAIKKSLEFRHGEDTQERKQDQSWVTKADTAIENEMRRLILKNHPEHNILGEEEGGELKEEGYTWVLDPIDGTFSFVHNVPFYSSLIAVFQGKTPIIGFAALPAMNIIMSAVKGQGAQINGEKYVRPKTIGQADIELIAVSDFYRFYGEKKEGVLDQFLNKQYKIRTYGDALGYYLLLNGSVRAFLDPKVEIWDIAPFHIILPEAGFAIHPWGQKGGLARGTSIAYAIDERKEPIHCADVIEIAAKFA